jgi:DNA-binding winged helix-turn-helix (wHTH) protein
MSASDRPTEATFLPMSSGAASSEPASSEPGNDAFAFGPFLLEPRERRLLRNGEPVPLTVKAFDLLEVLVRRQGRLLHKEELMQSVWPDAVVEENNLTVTMSALRKALGEGPSDREYIETVPRRGYRFVADVREVAVSTAPRTTEVTTPR